jgi:hypothetical protein
VNVAECEAVGGEWEEEEGEEKDLVSTLYVRVSIASLSLRGREWKCGIHGRRVGVVRSVVARASILDGAFADTCQKRIFIFERDVRCSNLVQNIG